MGQQHDFFEERMSNAPTAVAYFPSPPSLQSRQADMFDSAGFGTHNSVLERHRSFIDDIMPVAGSGDEAVVGESTAAWEGVAAGVNVSGGTTQAVAAALQKTPNPSAAHLAGGFVGWQGGAPGGASGSLGAAGQARSQRSMAAAAIPQAKEADPPVSVRDAPFLTACSCDSRPAPVVLMLTCQC
jgi:hypothetical protein